MALPRRRVLMVPVTGIAVAVAVAILLVNRDERPRDEGTPAPASTSLLFAEFGTNADRVFRAEARDPSVRSLVATIPHAPEWGINAAARPAGDLVAFTVLPATARPERDTPAELRVLDLADGRTRLLASDADLLTAPVFDRNGTHVVYRSDGELGTQTLVSVDLATGARRTVYELETTFGVYPVGFGADGRLLFASLSRGGTDLVRAGADGGPELVIHASDEVARDWQLSPDGKRIAFLVPQTQNERTVNRLRVVDLTTRSPLSVNSVQVPPAIEEYAPAWSPDGSAVTLGREAFPDARAGAVTYPLSGGTPSALAPPARGYDVPIDWSTDGQYLAVRSFDGMTTQDPGEESLVIVATSGGRMTVSAANEVLFLGWVASSG
ncbi:MAG: hypothetical protein K1X87_02405 [Dehalococcoidia bacterium]|nr:hypothetical protein [Dehalococcoidia bacterium]